MVYLATKLGDVWGFYVGKYSIHGKKMLTFDSYVWQKNANMTGVFVDGKWQTINMAYIRIRHGQRNGLNMGASNSTGRYSGKISNLCEHQWISMMDWKPPETHSPDAPCIEYSPRFTWGGRPHRRLFWPTQTYIQKIRQKHCFFSVFLQCVPSKTP